jgi:O-antigen/teichoic acid export membrane protein
MLKGLLKDSVIYGLSGIISSFISIFLIPLYTKVFEPSDYGIISIITTSLVFINILIIFGMDNSAAVWFWDSTSKEERKKTFNSWVWFLGLCSIVIMLLVIGLSTPLSYLFFSTGEYKILFVLLGINCLFTGFQKVVNIWCRMLQQPIKAMIFSLVILGMTLGFNIFFILYLRIGIKGVFFSQIIASATGFIFMFFLLRDWIDIKSFSKDRLLKMLKFSLPLVPAAILYWLMNMASVYFLKIFSFPNAEIGLYQIGVSVANILNLVAWAFFQAWTPFSLSVSKMPDSKDIYRKIFQLYCVIGFFASFTLMLFARDILQFFTRAAYIPAWFVLGLLAINIVILGIPKILSIANNLTKKNASYLVAMTLGSATTIICFIFFIPRYGKEGAAISMIAGNLGVCLYLAWKAQKLYYIPYNFSLIISLVLVLALGYLIGIEILEKFWLKVIFSFVMGLFTLISIFHFVLQSKLSTLSINLSKLKKDK